MIHVVFNTGLPDFQHAGLKFGPQSMGAESAESDTQGSDEGACADKKFSHDDCCPSQENF